METHLCLTQQFKSLGGSTHSGHHLWRHALWDCMQDTEVTERSDQLAKCGTLSRL